MASVHLPSANSLHKRLKVQFIDNDLYSGLFFVAKSRAMTSIWKSGNHGSEPSGPPNLEYGWKIIGQEEQEEGLCLSCRCWEWWGGGRFLILTDDVITDHCLFDAE
jgi:hypothetical protein